MRHFRDADELAKWMIEEHALQGVPIEFRDGEAFISVVDEAESGAIELTELNLTQTARNLWEALS